ncbi:hypothetical protein D3C84_1284840 [compost metagenome]
MFRVQKLKLRSSKLNPHEQRIDAAAEQHENGSDYIHDTDFFMIDGCQPFGPQPAPFLEVGKCDHDRYHGKTN